MGQISVQAAMAFQKLGLVADESQRLRISMNSLPSVS